MKMLYKKTSTGAIQQWIVYVLNSKIFTESGQAGGKITKSWDAITEGKNIGRSNETTPEEQALAEAKAKWIKKKKQGYVESIEDAKNDKVSELVEGGYTPMLAKSFDKHSKHIKFPCAAQPKLDGIRGTYTGGKHIWSRTRKEIFGVPHIAEALSELEDDCQAHGIEMRNFDGELYQHDYKEDFETIVHLVKQKKPIEGHEVVEYHVYDLAMEGSFLERMEIMENLKLHFVGSDSPIKIVDTEICENLEELQSFATRWMAMGYEGAMARNLDSPYEYKRSKHLQKLKVFEDAEFEIVGVEEGRGKLAGHAGAFICKTSNGDEFKVKMKGELSTLVDYLENFMAYKGSMVTVQFQGYTNRNSVPRFPVGLRIREEDI